MSTKIEWTNETWNPVSGCTKVSAGCDHCYIERTPPFRMAGRKFVSGLTSAATTGVVLHPDRLDQPLRWRKPRRVFVNSLSDLFHDSIPDDYIAQVFAVMRAATIHTFQVLTKRPGRMAALLASDKFLRRVEDALVARVGFRLGGEIPVWPLPNVWLGVSVEDQKWADVRIPKLLETPAAVRFLSCEPLLGLVDVPWLGKVEYQGAPGVDDGIDWVIAGGESGPGARPMHPDWVRSLRDQCVEAGVPFFFKQWGEWAPSRGRVRDQTLIWPDGTNQPGNGPPYTPPGWVNIERVGKKRSGRELDGRTWDEYPGEADAHRG